MDRIAERKDEMANIKDVAEKAGVTVTTVSRVMNNRGYISEKTRESVAKAMEELHYQPNELARALFRRRSNMLGLLLPSISHPFFAELTDQIESQAFKSGYKVLICNSQQDSGKEQEYLHMLKRNQVDGIIMGSHTLDVSAYASISMPIVAIDRFLSDTIPYISSDNYAGGRLATELLVSKGCRHLAHISGPLRLNTPANRRCSAFVDVAKERGIPYKVLETQLNNFEREEYEKLIHMLFDEYPDVDGIFASSDVIAACIIEVCVGMGKRIPQDIKVVGYDDIFLAAMFVPAISTIHQPIEEIARLAVEFIDRLREGETVPMENILPVKLIERKST
jgi:LacI family sucrose operon transcriptional repressor